MAEWDTLRERKIDYAPTAPETDQMEDEFCQAKEELAEVPYKRQIVWRNVISMLLLHLAALYGYFCMAFNPDVPWHDMIYIDVIARIASMGVLAGSHRLWAHRSYKARLPLRILLMILHTMSLQVFLEISKVSSPYKCFFIPCHCRMTSMTGAETIVCITNGQTRMQTHTTHDEASSSVTWAG